MTFFTFSPGPRMLSTAFLFLLSSCATADMRDGTLLEDKSTVDAQSQKRGQKILADFVAKHHYEKFSEIETYEVIGQEEWQGFFGAMGNPWPNTDPKMKMQFVPNTFNARIELLNSERKGDVFGRVESDTYTQSPGEKRVFDQDDLLAFNIANYHYWFEFPYRMSQLGNVTYAGEQEYNGLNYDVVFATWGDDLELNEDVDQYLMFFNKSTGRLDLVTFTYRSFPGMMPPNMYGTAKFSEYANWDGIQLPSVFTFQINGPSDESEFAHRLQVEQVRLSAGPRDALTRRASR